MTSPRIPSRYSNRLRRTLDQMKVDAEALDARVVIVEAGSSGSIDSTSVDINGTTSETVSDPTSYGQTLIRSVNKVTASGQHTVTFSGYLPNSSSVASYFSTTASSFFRAESGKHLDAWVWYITFNSGWT